MSDDDRTFKDSALDPFIDTGCVLYPGVNAVINETGSPEYLYLQRVDRNLNDEACGND